ncbi:hypothetical protein RRSWK_04357 [Rhodopirellula sp. SWK7]|nr:hypothetical protein RRSWK_04357 [Rhodopirellula sp. SWK7]
MIDAIPFGTMVRFLKKTIPLPIAIGVTLYFRVRKWLGISVIPAYGSGGPDNGEVVERQSMPPRPMSRWAAWLEQLDDLGFTVLRFSIGDHIGAKESAWAILLDSDRTTFATLQWFRMPGADGIEERRLIEFNTVVNRRGGRNATSVPTTELMTAVVSESDLGLQDAFVLDYIDTAYLPESVGLMKAWKNHVERLANYTTRSHSEDEAIRVYDRLTQGRFDWVLDKGYLRELTPKEIRLIAKNRLE